MARLKRYAHALASGYVLLGANTVFTLASVPLAFRYLKTAEFGLWATTAQIAGYIALIDFGMGGASRILIDYKDQKAGGEYGSVIQTTFWVSAVQAGLILIGGAVVALGLAAVVGVPETLRRPFAVLMIGQGVLLAGTFLSRVFQYVLAAHQLYDLANYAQTLGFAANFGVLWLGFHFGQGVYSMLWGQLAGWALVVVMSLFWCARRHLFPPTGAWGRPSWIRFRELFAYGRDIFLFQFGAQLVTASQTILLTRMLGLEAAAVWSVCTRAFQLIAQAIYRVFDFSCAALAEMIVREEREKLHERFRSVVMLSGSLSVAAAVLFAACNQAFVRVWSNGEIGWPAVNDALLALWLVVCVYTRTHVGLVGQTKQFRALSAVYFLEGFFFVGLSLLVLRRGGVTAMLLVSIATSLMFTFPYGLWRTSRYFGLPWRTVAWHWVWPSLRLGLVLAPMGYGAWKLSSPWTPEARLAAVGAPLGLLAVVLLFRLGLEPPLKEELARRAPARLRPALRWLSGVKTRAVPR